VNRLVQELTHFIKVRPSPNMRSWMVPLFEVQSAHVGKRMWSKDHICIATEIKADCYTRLHTYYSLFLAGESIPIRLFLSPYELTPTYKTVNNKFSVHYFLNLVLIDEEGRRYFKQHEITMYRSETVEPTRTWQPCSISEVFLPITNRAASWCNNVAWLIFEISIYL